MALKIIEQSTGADLDRIAQEMVASTEFLQALSVAPIAKIQPPKMSGIQRTLLWLQDWRAGRLCDRSARLRAKKMLHNRFAGHPELDFSRLVASNAWDHNKPLRVASTQLPPPKIARGNPGEVQNG